MDQHIKYIYFDLDGTILNKQKQISQELLSQIHKLQQHGIKVGIATGRHFAMTKYLLAQIQPDLPTITNNGANICWSESEVISLSTISSNDAHAIISWLQNHDADFLVYTQKHLYTNSMDNVRVQFLLAAMAQQNTNSLMWQYHIYHHEVLTSEQVAKILLCTPKLSASFNAFLDANFPHLIHCSSEQGLEDVNLVGTDKYYALVNALATINITNYDQLLYFGDGHNDLLSLQNFPNSVCVGNNHPELVAVSKYVVDSSDQFGVEKFLRKHFRLLG